MKVVIFGSRTLDKYDITAWAIDRSNFQITEVLSGHARGPDKFGEMWATANQIPIRLYKPDWKTHPKTAGFIRNQEMAEDCDAGIAVWDGVSNGTKNTIDHIKRLRKPLYVLIWPLEYDSLLKTNRPINPMGNRDKITEQQYEGT